MILTLFFFSEQRNKLPPGRFCTGFMHTYLCNGVASWEIALWFESVTERANVTLDVLLECCLSAQWVANKHTRRTAGYLKSLFHPRLFGEGIFSK